MEFTFEHWGDVKILRFDAEPTHSWRYINLVV